MEVSKKTKEQKEKDSQQASNNDHLLNKIFFQKYRTIKKLGEGSFGKVHKVEYKKYIKPNLKIKLEIQVFLKVKQK